MRREDLWAMPASELATVLSNGGPVDDDALAGADFRGVSLGLPSVVERVTWKTFRKSFRRADDGGVDGFNVRVEQTGTGVPTVPRLARGRPVTFGPYRVRALPEGEPFRCRAGVLLDYGARHPAWHPLSPARDVLVAIDGEQDLLLGALYLEVGGLRLRTPSFFTLERERA